MKIFNSKGITLVSLVVTIIILIILAGVAISNVIGNHSSVNRAEQAKLTEEQQSKKEVLEQALIKYNSGDYIGDGDLAAFLIEELDISEFYESNKKNIAKFTDLSGLDSYIIHDFKGESAYLTSEDGLWKIQAFSNLGYLGKLQDGDTLISPKSNETFEIEDDDTQYSIVESDDSLKDISFDIPAGKTVTIRLLSDMVITNEGLQRAAINLNEGSTLNLEVHGNVTVNSTYGKNGAISNSKQVESDGGYAGIYVDKTATLNLSGTGTIKCYGGNAGKGGTFTGGTHGGGSGGGGAGAGIGGNGGNGGAGRSGISNSGGNGLDCGTVNISGNLTVYAYGGAGASGGEGFYNISSNVNGSGGGRRLSCSWNRWRRSRRPEAVLVVLVQEDILEVLLKLTIIKIIKTVV